MGAKLSRRKSESAAGADGVAAESPTTEQPETAEVITATESDEQKPEAGDSKGEAEPKPTEVSPEVDETPSEPATEPGPLETVTQAVEKIVSDVSEQIAGPVEDIVNKGLGAVEAMMAAVSVKDDPTEEVAAAAPAPAPEAKDEPMVDISFAAAPKIDFSIPEPPEEPEHLPSEHSAVEDLLLSQSIPECLLPEPVPTAVVKDVTLEAEKNLGLPSELETHAPLEIEESLVFVKQEAAPVEPPLNCDMGADPTPLNSDPLVDLGDMEQAMSTAVSTVIDLI
ncbi:neuromodulin [Astyanax mexicanus]|uniref:neuromodulin n=1 Tax=Astyanax mexicanus TaxID=7994 RepID=UPI0020CB28CD|nr:neuromodulin [Astyanax mexicanus]